jgi:GT2 family glycosyltransferase
LAESLKRSPKVGVIGPRLLFEDGSVQHEGLIYRRLSEFGGWTFIDHENKGRRPQPRTGTRIAAAITGACMLMRRSLALELGGFDEAYVIGDFEDSDLCLRLKQRGLASAVDNDVEAHHLERQSQALKESNVRMNVTLYNAWLHERRWFADAPSSAATGSTA